jgi:hypothetical protein
LDQVDEKASPSCGPLLCVSDIETIGLVQMRLPEILPSEAKTAEKLEKKEEETEEKYIMKSWKTGVT